MLLLKVPVINYHVPKNIKKTILVIDDSPDNQQLLEMLLVANGYEVQCASNGADALVLLTELLPLPDIILLDAQMPVMDGYQFRSEQKRIDRLKNIPVIIMSGDDDPDMNERMIQPRGIMTKPLHIQSLVENISQHIL